MNKQEEIMKAIISLGYPEDTIVITLEIGKDREAVFIDGEVMGIYDFQKHTFVD